MAKKNNGNMTNFIGIAIVAIILYGGNAGWFDTNIYSSTTNVQSPAAQAAQAIVLPTESSSLTCAQKAQANNAYYTEQFTTAKECLDYSVLDCQDKGQIIVGYAMDGTCCYYTCEAVAPVATCTDTDGGQDDQFLVYGSCESSVTGSGTWDQCINGNLVESYCAADKTCQTTTVACGAEQVCSGGKCVVANSICDYECGLAGYDSNLCVAFNINGALSMEQACANNNGVFANIYNACTTGNICCCR